MKHFITLMLCLVPLTACSQKTFDAAKISIATGAAVSKIEKVNEVMGSVVYEAEMRPEQYDFFDQLKTHASKEELIELTDHPNGAVRCYAFWALSYDQHTNLLPIVLKHINDDESVETQFGCIGSRTKVGDFFIDIVTPLHLDQNLKKLGPEQLAELDSILIFTANNLNARLRAIGAAKPAEKWYPRIRELIVKEDIQMALVALAKYQKTEDIELILKNKEKSKSNAGVYWYTYEAISEFPHPDFLPFLENNLIKTMGDNYYRNELSPLYKAISNYRNQKAVDLLNVPFIEVRYADVRKYHMRAIFAAIQSCKDSIYNELLWKLWANERILSSNVYKYLLAIDSRRTLQLATKSLVNAEDLYVDNIFNESYEMDTEEKLIDLMLDLVLKRDRWRGLEIIKDNIGEANVHKFSVFANKASVVQDKVFVEPLFKQLETANNPYVYLEAATALIAFQDGAVNKRIVATRKKNNNLNIGWGSQALDKMLKEKNIE
jgi:hypothetical protein